MSIVNKMSSWNKVVVPGEARDLGVGLHHRGAGKNPGPWLCS
jgi:hypothetical protein